MFSLRIRNVNRHAQFDRALFGVSYEAKQMLQMVQPYVVHVVEHGNVACNGIQLECLLHALLLAATKDDQLVHGIVAHDVGVDVEQLKRVRKGERIR